MNRISHAFDRLGRSVLANIEEMGKIIILFFGVFLSTYHFVVDSSNLDISLTLKIYSLATTAL